MEGENDILKIHGMHDRAKPEIFRYASALRSKMTLQEKLVWNYLKTKPLGFKFRRQHPINKYVLDFYCHAKRISIEIDGKNHNERFQQEIDEARTDYLKNVGITEIRISNSDITNNFISFKDIMMNLLQY